MNNDQNFYPPFQTLKTIIEQTHQPQRNLMTRAYIRTNHWRQNLLLNTFRAKEGNTVFSGPFKGMTYLDAAEGALLPRLIGCYEAELHSTILEMKSAGYENIIDIGCAEGYYAVGLARLFNDATVYAHDISEAAQKACTALAKVNHVSDRVHVGGVFDGNTLKQYVHEKTLVICDIEGAEEQLLDPDSYPSFRDVDLIVEVHECYKPGLIQTLSERFSASHDIEWVWQSASAPRDLPNWTKDFSHLDQILCTWEWRSGPTPWAIMRSRSLAAKNSDAHLPVVFALHDADGQYWMNTAVAITSIIQHTSKPLHIHILHDDTLCDVAHCQMTAIAQGSATPISFTHVSLPKHLDAKTLHRFSVASLYRLLIPQLFINASKVIYLDSDLVSHGVDLYELAQQLPNNSPIGGVTDPYIGREIKTNKLLNKLGVSSDDYMNSGVLVLHPRLIQEDLLTEFMAFTQLQPDAIHPDQDFLNVHFKGKFTKLPEKFNHQVCLFNRSLFQPLSSYQDKILHYAGKIKPLDGNLAPGMLPFWMYAHATPAINGLSPKMRYLQPIKAKPDAVYRSIVTNEKDLNASS